MARSRLEQDTKGLDQEIESKDGSGRKNTSREGVEKTLPSRSILSLQLQLLAAAVAVELLVVQNGLAWLSDWMWR